MKKIKNLKLTSGKKSVLGMMWWGGRVLPFPASGNLPVKDKTILAKTPQFSRFLPNSRLKYGKYVCVRLCQKSSKTRRQTTICFILDRHSKNLLCKLTFDGAFSLAIEIGFRLRRVLASKSPPIEKARWCLVLGLRWRGGRVLPFPASGNPTARICFAN